MIKILSSNPRLDATVLDRRALVLSVVLLSGQHANHLVTGSAFASIFAVGSESGGLEILGSTRIESLDQIEWIQVGKFK